MKKKRIKIRWSKVIVLAVIITLVVLGIYLYTSIPVRTIYVTGNKILSENEVLKSTNLLSYPKIYTLSETMMEKDLLKNPLIKKAEVTKSLSGKVTISIIENKILYQDSANNIMLSSGKIIENREISGIPTLINEVVDVEDKFIDKMTLIKQDILIHISEIEYKPSDLDKERFLFYMSDGNYVYITLSKIDLINSYNEIYPTLEGKKGILYLDSGNHFEIKKSD